ncbi:GMC oxidoreductase domain-containing protein [Cordyceps javanica]|uniref:GMC oxidoreductase domain-containing protein n=1 Tax=Cordyceps javanica TaxID=43265 RepID=A0A545V3T0_9HYPO|nr:GMC oxidoreductase domain-containing protein [Cordyceps javanica]
MQQWFSLQLLIVSGVGSAGTLTQHGIKVVADVPGVGQNQWVHNSREMMQMHKACRILTQRAGSSIPVAYIPGQCEDKL